MDGQTAILKMKRDDRETVFNITLTKNIMFDYSPCQQWSL